MKKALIICAMVLLSGCLSVRYNPSTGEIEYERQFLSHKLGSLHAEVVDPNGTKTYIYVDKSESDNIKAVGDAIGILQEVVD